MNYDKNKPIKIQHNDDITSKDHHGPPISKEKSLNISHQRVKCKTRKIFIGLIISLSALMFGYSLKEITSVPIATLVT